MTHVSCTDPAAISIACLGTTHFINAVIRRQGLARVAVLRLCGPATVALPPFCDMPPGLCEGIGCSYHLLSGESKYPSVLLHTYNGDVLHGFVPVQMHACA